MPQPSLYNRLAVFADAAVFFPAANICNFMQGHDPVATGIAVLNLLYSLVFIGLQRHQKKPTGFIRRETMNPLRVTAYCALGIGGLLLLNALEGNDAAIFPGLAALFFGIGNYIQSGAQALSRKSFLHPAIWYGGGYAMTGIAIGGGLVLLQHPSDHLAALLLTVIGITETTAALALLMSGHITNKSTPFVGVAMGTVFFALTGIINGNILGAATGLFACAGELSLAIKMQKLHNASHSQTPDYTASKIEQCLVFPITAAMKRGWIARLPD